MGYVTRPDQPPIIQTAGKTAATHTDVDRPTTGGGSASDVPDMPTNGGQGGVAQGKTSAGIEGTAEELPMLQGGVVGVANTEESNYLGYVHAVSVAHFFTQSASIGVADGT